MVFARSSRLALSSTNSALTSYLTRASYRRFSSTSPASYEYILTETPKPGVGLSTFLLDHHHVYSLLTNQVTLNRPKALNALSSPLFQELNDALSKYDQDKDIGAIVITGSEKAFAGQSTSYLYKVMY